MARPSNVNFATGANFQEGMAILNPVIQEVINQSTAQVGLTDQMTDLGFVMGDALTPEGEITGMVGPEELEEMDEDGVAALVTIMQGWTKKYQLKEYGLKHKCTKIFAKWIEQGAQMQGADSSVKMELYKFKEATERLVHGAILTRNRVMTEVFGLGFVSTNAYGPGSATGDGVPLFSASHVVKKTGATFSNLLGSALTATSLQAAIQTYKTAIYCPNGYRVETPDIFTLYVPRALETAARVILNSTSDQAGVYAGTANNANLLNVFSFNGSKVRLVVIKMLGELKRDGTKIGGANADNMWFLANTEYNLKYKAFRVFQLWDKEMNMWKDDETDSIFTKITSYFTADAYNFE